MIKKTASLKGSKKKLIFIKSIHTVIWLFYVFVLFYIMYASIFNKLDKFVYIAIGLVILEGLILIINHCRCPLTTISYKYSDNHEIGFDIFLPKLLAKYNKKIFLAFFIFEIFLVLYRIYK